MVELKEKPGSSRSWLYVRVVKKKNPPEQPPIWAWRLREGKRVAQSHTATVGGARIKIPSLDHCLKSFSPPHTAFLTFVWGRAKRQAI